MLAMPVKTFFFNYMARVERIMDDICSAPEYRVRGGDFPASTANFSFTSLLLLYQHASLSAYKPQRKVLFGTQQAYGILSPLSVSRKGGERNGEDDLASDTSLVHSQLQVRALRGGVSPGQYHSTVMAT